MRNVVDRRLLQNQNFEVFLFGSEVKESLSPMIHNTLFKELGLNAEYSLYEVKSEKAFLSAVLKIRNKSVLGFNITAPFKQTILSNLDSIDGKARAVGAVNTVKLDRAGVLSGYNTDFEGVLASLTKLRVRKGSAMILGAGGAARACVYALAQRELQSITILNRTLETAQELATSFSKKFPKCEILAHPLPDHLTVDCDLLINAISDTAFQRGFPMKIQYQEGKTKVLDLGYKMRSIVLDGAKRAGLKNMDGFEMLVEQAAKSFEIWTGIRPGARMIELAARSALRESKRKRGK